MKKREIIDLIAKGLNGHIQEGRSAGIKDNQMTIKITDNDGKQFLISVNELIE